MQSIDLLQQASLFVFVMHMTATLKYDHYNELLLGKKSQNFQRMQSIYNM